MGCIGSFPREFRFLSSTDGLSAVLICRRAVDINPRDYRAWYGLGQAYELIMMPYYALYYFRRATQLRPQDARMWCAMGQCYENEQLAMDDAAVHCYQRAVSNNDREGIALNKLAKIHERQAGTATPRFRPLFLLFVVICPLLCLHTLTHGVVMVVVVVIVSMFVVCCRRRCLLTEPDRM
eukprot:scaffold513753_cov27-Prasinocladus_malaysianus.AAC.2